jgi:hypothetical protein
MDLLLTQVCGAVGSSHKIGTCLVIVLEFDSDSALIGNLLALIARAKKLLGRGKTKYIKNIERQL